MDMVAVRQLSVIKVLSLEIILGIKMETTNGYSDLVFRGELGCRLQRTDAA